MRRLVFVGLVVFAVAACADRDVTGVSDEVAVLDQGPEFHIARGAGQLKVMSQNMYFGAAVDPIIAEPIPELIPVRVAEAWATMIRTDFPARARAMAAEMAQAKPHLIGLQEVAIYRTKDDFFTNPNPAETVFLDFLEILLDELEARDAHYEVAVELVTTDVEFPKLDGWDGQMPILNGVRLTDRDVILARSDVPVRDAVADSFHTWFGPGFDPKIDIPVDVYRG